MNKTQIQEHNDEALLDVDLLLDDLIKKRHVPYLNSVIVANGLLDTVNQIRNGFDTNYHTAKLTPYQRAVFVWAYLEVLEGFIEYALSEHGMPESIAVPK